MLASVFVFIYSYMQMFNHLRFYDLDFLTPTFQALVLETLNNWFHKMGEAVGNII